jgi:HK97 family phage prohead protease
MDLRERTFLLEDIAIRSGGDGRTVVAYAAVFGVPAEIHDQDGHYHETIGHGAFDKTLAEQAGRIQVFYNHGKTLYGTPSERFSMPLGTPEEMTADGRGLLTVTRYNKTPLADEVLESIRNGDIKGQSFSGRFIPGKSQRSRGRDGAPDTILRSEVALREYGPTPMPSYKEASIVGVRAEQLAPLIDNLDPDERAELIKILSTPAGEPLPAAEAAPQGTSPANDTPATSHLSGPAPSERRLYVARFRKAS